MEEMAMEESDYSQVVPRRTASIRSPHSFGYNTHCFVDNVFLYLVGVESMLRLGQVFD
jgi:hypothetical protein